MFNLLYENSFMNSLNNIWLYLPIIFNNILKLSMLEVIFRIFYSYFFIKSKSTFKYLGHNKCILKIDDISTHFPCFKYAKDVNLSFKGWIPMQFEDDDFIYNIGLPQRIHPGHEITIKNLDEKTEITFTSKNESINWEEVFDVFVKPKFHDDLD